MIWHGSLVCATSRRHGEENSTASFKSRMQNFVKKKVKKKKEKKGKMRNISRCRRIITRKLNLKKLTSIVLIVRVSNNGLCVTSRDVSSRLVCTLIRVLPLTGDTRALGDGEKAIATSKRDRQGGADGEKREWRGTGKEERAWIMLTYYRFWYRVLRLARKQKTPSAIRDTRRGLVKNRLCF